jgi:hypothetical protein
MVALSIAFIGNGHEKDDPVMCHMPVKKLTMIYTATVIAQCAVLSPCEEICVRGFQLPLPEFFHDLRRLSLLGLRPAVVERSP